VVRGAQCSGHSDYALSSCVTGFGGDLNDLFIEGVNGDGAWSHPTVAIADNNRPWGGAEVLTQLWRPGARGGHISMCSDHTLTSGVLEPGGDLKDLALEAVDETGSRVTVASGANHYSWEA
jgi:hypothetical protein